MVAITRPRKYLSGDAIFSRRGRLVIAVLQTTRPSRTASFWILPSGEAAYRYARSGSATGVAVVMRYDPAHELYSEGVYSHRIVPLAASIASVLPYVVVTKKTPRR